ncbi:MAG: ATP-binding protein, partial [Flavipsychrobacter sp.]
SRKFLPLSLYNAMAIIYTYKGDRKPAVYYFYKALNYANRYKINNNVVLANVNLNLAILWMQDCQYKQAIYHTSKGLKLAIECKDSTQIVNAYSILGGIYIQKGDSIPGRKFSETAYALAQHNVKPQDYKRLEYVINLNLGISYQHEDPEKALNFYKKALAASNTNTFYSDISPYAAIGTIYSNLGKYKEAEKYLLTALDKATLTKQLNSIQDISPILAANYALQKNYKKAYEYQKLYSTVADTLQDSAHIMANHELEVKYRTAEKDKELVAEKLQIMQQKHIAERKNMVMGGTVLGAILIIALLGTVYTISRNRQRLQSEKIKNLEQEKKIIHLKALVKGEEKERTRIARELHDGVGSLLSAFTISFQALGKENEQIANTPNYINSSCLLKQISSEIHEAAYNFTPEVLLHNSLIEAIRLYCDYIQFPKSRNIEIDVSGYGEFELLEHEFKLSIYRIVQELLQNIVKHAHATHVIVQLVMQGSALNITVEDNGVGFDTGRNDNGLGILNLQSRIRSMNGHISIESSKGNGTSVFIEFDLKAHKQLSSI